MINWEIVSWVLNLLLLVWAITERVLSMRDRIHIKSSIRVWQQQALGIKNALQKLTASADGERFSFSEKFTKVRDVGLALGAVNEVADSLSQSLYETRFFSDEELKENIKADAQRKELQEQLISEKPRKKRKKRAPVQDAGDVET